VIVSLSAKGRRVNAHIENMISDMEREFMTVLSENDRECFYSCLDRLRVRADELFSE
jgi:DNA-binding MarR family transcriptional regulator